MNVLVKIHNIQLTISIRPHSVSTCQLRI